MCEYRPSRHESLIANATAESKHWSMWRDSRDLLSVHACRDDAAHASRARQRSIDIAISTNVWTFTSGSNILVQGPRSGRIWPDNAVACRAACDSNDRMDV